jgi:Arc/MetJ-type ribon-helix-helix transcriptional regulator
MKNSINTAKFTISLKNEMVEFLDNQVATSKFTRSSYIASLLRAEQQRIEAKLKRVTK